MKIYSSKVAEIKTPSNMKYKNSAAKWCGCYERLMPAFSNVRILSLQVIRFRLKEKIERVYTLLDYYSFDFRSKINCYLYKVIVTVVQRPSPVNFHSKLTFKVPRCGFWSWGLKRTRQRETARGVRGHASPEKF